MLKGLQRVSFLACCALGTVIACVLMVQNWDKVNVNPVVRAQDSPQNPSKFVDIEPNSLYQGMRVVKVTVGDQVVIPGPFNRHKGPAGVPFQAGDDWLKTMTFTLKNRSTKKIVQVQFDILFPETGAPDTLEGTVGQEVVLGRMPDVNSYTKDGVKIGPDRRQPLDLGPGQEMTISLAPYACDLRKRIEGHQPFSTITRCFINVTLAYFEDGMVCIIADYQVPDPSHPGRYLHVNRADYPINPKAEE